LIRDRFARRARLEWPYRPQATLDEPESEGPPPLITVLVTRRIRGQLIGLLTLVDRTCLGVKNANLIPLQPEQMLREFVAEVVRPMTELRECEPSEAQAVVFHAIDYAASLGFGYHPDFEPSLLAPRPGTLRDTPLAHPARPLYASGPNDDVAMILEHLDSTVGAQNYAVVDGFGEGWLNDDDDDDNDDDDTIETSAEEIE
jgi:hypothetical protein